MTESSRTTTLSVPAVNIETQKPDTTYRAEVEPVPAEIIFAGGSVIADEQMPALLFLLSVTAAHGLTLQKRSRSIFIKQMRLSAASDREVGETYLSVSEALESRLTHRELWWWLVLAVGGLLVGGLFVASLARSLVFINLQGTAMLCVVWIGLTITLFHIGVSKSRRRSL